MKYNLMANTVFLLLRAAFALAILGLISSLHLASFVTMTPKYLKYSIYSGCLLFITTCICEGCVGIVLTLGFFPPQSIPFNKSSISISLYTQVRSKDSQVKTQLVLWIFILFKVTTCFGLYHQTIIRSQVNNRI